MCCSTAGLAESREKARALILAGQVFVAGAQVDKVATPVAEEAEIEVRGGPPYVSRGGFKLAGALDTFGLDRGLGGGGCRRINRRFY